MSEKSDKKDEFKFFTANCKLKFNASHFPCECQPWFDYYYGSSFVEPDCSNCSVVKKYGAVPEQEVMKEIEKITITLNDSV